MIYKLDNIPISTYGAIPTQGKSLLALDGLFDLPKRIGATEHNWGTSIEPLVSAQDIALDGRQLTLTTAMRHNKVKSFIDACIACKSLQIDFDSFSVVCRDEIEVERIGEYSKVVVKLWQNEFVLSPLTRTPSANGDWRIDDFDLRKDFGVYVSEAANLQNSGKRIEVNTTEFYTKTNYRSTRDVNLNCFMKTDSMSNLYATMKQFQALIMSPGMRTLKVKNDSFELYFKDGVKADYLGDYFLNFSIKGVIV